LFALEQSFRYEECHSIVQAKVNANRASGRGDDTRSFNYAERHSIKSAETNDLFRSMSQDGMIRPWIFPDQWRYPQDKVVMPARPRRLADSGRLADLAVPHEFHEIGGAGHDIAQTIDGLGERYFAFWRA
jgi:hypothetical protein